MGNETKQPGNNKDVKNAPAPTVKLTPEQVEAKKKALFKELAPKRTRQILKALEILGNCSNRSGYSFTDENVAKIFTTIEKKVAETKTMFSTKAKDAAVTFTLD
jgi:hypothetical protein